MIRIFDGGDVGNLLIQKGGIFDGNFSYYIAGFAVYLIVGLTAVYTMFLLALSRIALAVLLALGPMFITLILFDNTKRFFEAWIAQLANYAFIAILSVLMAALMLHLLESAAPQQAVAAGGGIQIAHALRVCMAAGLTFLVMRQVMPMAAALASGFALSTFGVVSAAVVWGLGMTKRNTGQFMRGLVIGSGDDPLGRPLAQEWLCIATGSGRRRPKAVPDAPGQHHHTGINNEGLDNTHRADRAHGLRDTRDQGEL